MSSPSNRSVNPYKKGKAKVIASLILDGKTNEQILEFIKSNKLDATLKAPVSMENINYVRAGLRRKKLIDSDGQNIGKPPEDTASPSLRGSTGESSERFSEGGEQRGATEQPPNATEFVKRPDWDVLTVEQINSLPDPKLKIQILNYKTEIAKIKQELKPEYVTRGEIDQLRVELITTINELIKSVGENSDDEESEVEGESEIIKVLPTQNRLIGETAEKAEDDSDEVIEVEGSIIAKKTIGFTAKSMMLFDLAKAQGFPGNVADFVNSCINDAFKGRNIELAVIDKKVIK